MRKVWKSRLFEVSSITSDKNMSGVFSYQTEAPLNSGLDKKAFGPLNGSFYRMTFLDIFYALVNFFQL